MAAAMHSCLRNKYWCNSAVCQCGQLLWSMPWPEWPQVTRGYHRFPLVGIGDQNRLTTLWYCTLLWVARAVANILLPWEHDDWLLKVVCWLPRGWGQSLWGFWASYEYWHMIGNWWHSRILMLMLVVVIISWCDKPIVLALSSLLLRLLMSIIPEEIMYHHEFLSE